MENKEMELKKKKSKTGFMIFEIIIGILFILGFIACIVIEVVAEGTDFATWVKDNIWDINATITSFKSQLSIIVHCLIYIILIYAICKLVRLILHQQIKKSNRAKTVVTLIDGLVKYGCAIALIILILKACGVNTTALFASVGILTLIIGLGAQSLIADVIAGIFIIFENEYNVGEIISIDDFRGTVIEIGIRSTKLLDLAGNIKIINNSNINNVVNMSRELSLAVVDCEFPYDVPLEKIENMINDNLESFKERIPAIIEGPFYKGVSYYAESNVAIKLVARCSEADRYQVQRDLLREYRVELLKLGVDISYPQVVLNKAVEKNVTVTEKETNDANRFVSEQKEISKNYDDQK